MDLSIITSIIRERLRYLSKHVDRLKLVKKRAVRIKHGDSSTSQLYTSCLMNNNH